MEVYMKKLLFLTKYRKEASREENLINLLRHMLRAGFKVNNLPKKYQYLEKEKQNGQSYKNYSGKKSKSVTKT